MKKGTIVLGLMFGDEGKGQEVHDLCFSHIKPNGVKPIVVRFNGGHQCGHTVVYNGIRHVFSNFGSGSLLGCETYWSKYCTVHPEGYIAERNKLREYGLDPVVYFDKNCEITTPFDIFQNRNSVSIKHGSCGVGFGETIKRSENYYHLRIMDLAYPSVVKEKLKNIQNSYYKNPPSSVDIDDYTDFLVKFGKTIKTDSDYFNDLDSYFIFEGGQGILLDMDHGFFPNVTRSNTTSKNAMEFAYNSFIKIEEIRYVTRCYQTRHGNGYMFNEYEKVDLINNENETNVLNDYQGKFRTAPFSLEGAKYALEVDQQFSFNKEKSLIVTCMDQFEDEIPLFNNGIIKINKPEFRSYLETHLNINVLNKNWNNN